MLIGSAAEQRGDAVGARPASQGRCHCAERRVSRRTGRDARGGTHGGVEVTPSLGHSDLSLRAFKDKLLPRKATPPHGAEESGADRRFGCCSHSTRTLWAGQPGDAAGGGESGPVRGRRRGTCRLPGAARPSPARVLLSHARLTLGRLNHREGRRRGRPHAQLRLPAPTPAGGSPGQAEPAPWAQRAKGDVS